MGLGTTDGTAGMLSKNVRMGKKPKYPPSRTRGLRPWGPDNPPPPPARPIGASIKECMNQFASKKLDELRLIATDPNETSARAIAANRLLGAMERPDIGQFAGYLAGKEELADVKARGIDTAIIKRAKIGAKGEREIELHDRGMAEAEFVTHESDGAPKQPIDMTAQITANVAFSFAPIPEGD